jgi:hypothetical protein
MALKWPDKDPEALKDYSLDWSAMLATAEVIESSAWSVLPTGLTLNGLPASFTDSVTTVWLSGGTAGVAYVVKNTIETDRGLIDERSITIKIKEQ